MSEAFTHQTDGGRWLARRQRAILGDIPGLGKTRTALLGVQALGLGAPGVICPASALAVWKREAQIIGLPADPVTLSFDVITRRGLDYARREFAGRPVIVDEFHRGRLMTSQRTQWLFSNSGLIRNWPLPAWLLSGTPSVRNPMDLWPALSACWPQLLAHYGILTAAEWERRTCDVIYHEKFVPGRGTVNTKKVVGVKDAAIVNEILSRTMLRRTLDDVGLDVPRVFHQELAVVVQQDDDDIDEEVVKRIFFDAQFTNTVLEALKNDPHWARYRRRLGEQKVQPLIAELREQLADSDEKVVVFAHHTSVLAALAAGLNEFGVAFVDGSVSSAKRAAEINLFQTSPRCRVFVGQNHACMESITLTAARRVLLLEPDPVAGVNAQLVQRVARIGSTASRCIAQWVVAEGTLDRQIVAQNIRETEMVEKITPSTAADHAETR